MSIGVPAVGDLATASWADSVGNRLNNNGLLQTGQVTINAVANTDTFTSVSFPTAFSAAPLVYLTFNGNPSGSGHSIIMGATAISATGFNCHLLRDSAGNTTISWLAIGPA